MGHRLSHPRGTDAIHSSENMLFLSNRSCKQALFLDRGIPTEYSLPRAVISGKDTVSQGLRQTLAARGTRLHAGEIR